MGTGVGEAMLIGAAVGATTGGAGAAIQGGDPLKGALMGGAMGAIGGGLGAAAPAATTATTATTAGASGAGGASAVPGTLSAGATPVGLSSAGTSAVGGGTLPGATISSVADVGAGISGVGSGSGTLGSAGFGNAGIGTSTSTGNLLTTGPLGTSTGVTGGVSPSLTAGLSAPGPTTPSSPNIFGYRPGEEGYLSNARLGAIGATSGLSGLMQAERAQYSGGPPIEPEKRKSSFDPASFAPSRPTYAPEGVYVPEYKDYRTAAEGGIMQSYQAGGPVERMSMMNTAMNPQGGLYPQGMIDKTQYAVPTQRPVSSEMVMDTPGYERSNPMLMAEGGITEILEAAKAQGLTPQAYQQIYGRGNRITEMDKALKEGQMVNMASGGISSLGGYSDGGRMLKGPGDGMSDSIPGVIAGKQPARLADGEFVVPADVVSHLGNGSTDAGAKQLYAMMDKVRKARTGKKKQAPAVKANRYMPA